MGRPIDVNSAIVNTANIGKISNLQNNKDENQQKQFALIMKEQSVRKETQVQTQKKVEAPEIPLKKEGNSKRRKKQKKNDQHGDNDDKDHIDLKVY